MAKLCQHTLLLDQLRQWLLVLLALVQLRDKIEIDLITAHVGNSSLLWDGVLDDVGGELIIWLEVVLDVLLLVLEDDIESCLDVRLWVHAESLCVFKRVDLLGDQLVKVIQFRVITYRDLQEVRALLV